MSKTTNVLVMILIALFIWSCQKEEFWEEKSSSETNAVTFREKPGGETAGNNLSFPVIWAEGVPLPLRSVPVEAVNAQRIQNQHRYGMPLSTQALLYDPAYLLDGEWWYWWGTDIDGNPEACPYDPDDPKYCNDGKVGTVGPLPGPGWLKVYVQKDPDNIWLAEVDDATADPLINGPVNVDWIDWGDNLESVDWYTKSKVRTEVVLFKDLTEPMVEFEMRHLSGLGINEIHGVATDEDGVPYNTADHPDRGLGNQATVYSECAQFMIQKLMVDREEIVEGQLTFDPSTGWTEAEGVTVNLINDPIFDKAVYEAGDGPGYYNAEVNVKGRVIFGYTWDVRSLNDNTNTEDPTGPPDPSGDYRLTFSFDDECPYDLNTFFANAHILEPVEEVVVPVAESEPVGGGTAVVDYLYNLTYIDVRILSGKTGNNSGNGGGGGNSDGNNKGGGNDNGKGNSGT